MFLFRKSMNSQKRNERFRIDYECE